ncbi:MAG: hypothetical protein M3Y82_07250, partial [Verrucomicrobiota bacterium]|nr:hypothetical protein [Verrucomicrobiota bacterium]
MKKLLALLAISLTFIAPTVWAGTYFFSNTNAITINDHTSATPYPSGISVSGIPLNEKIDKITVTFHNLSHTFPGDIDMLLVAPSGTNLILFSDAGNNLEISGVTVTLDDDALTSLPSTNVIVSGVFKPTNYGAAIDPFPAPAPAPSMATNLSIFKGTNPNGIWNLFVVDDATIDTGSIAGGWSLTIRTAALYTNSTWITIEDYIAPFESLPIQAFPYPSSIVVSNLTGNVVKVTATLNGFGRTSAGFADFFPEWVRVLLVSPAGTNLVLMS